MPTLPILPSLVADVGGTNTRVALADGGVVRPGSVRRYLNSDFASLAAVIGQFMAETGLAVGAACLAVAGPVRGGIGRLTNLDWAMSGAELGRLTGATRVAILNDLTAQGHALGTGARGVPVIEAQPDPGGTRLVIGVGTGFNAAVVHATAGGRIVAASEAGHVTLPVRCEADLRLMRHLAATHGFAGVEDVVSGSGLSRIDGWLAEEAGTPAAGRAPAAILTALHAGEARATAATQTLVRFLGAVAGDLALIHLPFGGIFLVGGMASTLRPLLDRFGFDDAFRDKGRFADFMRAFAVAVIDDDLAALSGCARHLQGLGSPGIDPGQPSRQS